MVIFHSYVTNYQKVHDIPMCRQRWNRPHLAHRFDPGIAAPAAEPRDSASSKPFSKAGRNEGGRRPWLFPRKSWENHGKTVEIHGKLMENHWNMMDNAMKIH
jgi:hypothetical protein